MRDIFVFRVFVALALLTTLAGGVLALAEAPANDAFERTWSYTDQPVAEGVATRTWLWGQEGLTGALTEPYAESPDGERIVQYFDKARMEITSPDADPESLWYVTNGLLVLELVTGKVQIGHDAVLQKLPSSTPVAGDPDDLLGPTYQTLAVLLDQPAVAEGTTLTLRVDRAGQISDDPALATQGVTAAQHVQVGAVDHTIAAPFWEFMNSTGVVWDEGAFQEGPLFPNPFYATGYPVTEAYWAQVKVAGTVKDVLIQAFERRVLTYTPGNAPGWQVEAGNVGRHYYGWRYDEPFDPPRPEPPDPLPPTPPPPPAPPSPLPNSDHGFVAIWDGADTTAGPLEVPGGVALDEAGNIFVADSGNDRILKFSPTGEGVILAFGSSGSGAGEFDSPQGLDVDAEGRIFVLDSGNDRVQVFNNKGEYLYLWGATGTGEGQFQDPLGLAIGQGGNVYVADTGNNRIQVFTGAGEFIHAWGGLGNEDFEFHRPEDVAVDAGGSVFVADSWNSRVMSYTSDGLTHLQEWGVDQSGDSGLNTPSGVAVDLLGHVYVVDSATGRALEFTHGGDEILDYWGATGTGEGYLLNPTGVAVNADGHVFVADTGNDRIQEFAPAAEQ